MYDMAFINGTIHRISGAYKWELESGLLEIIVPPVEYYPDLNNLGVDLMYAFVNTPPIVTRNNVSIFFVCLLQSVSMTRPNA